MVPLAARGKRRVAVMMYHTLTHRPPVNLGHSPWGAIQHREEIAPGICSVSTAGHGGIMLDAAHVARIPRAIGAGYSGTISAWDADADWAVPYLLFEPEFATWEPVRRLGAAKMRAHARAGLAYRPDWLAVIDRCGVQLPLLA